MQNLKTLKLNRASCNDEVTTLKAGEFNGDGMMDMVVDGSSYSQSGLIVFNSNLYVYYRNCDRINTSQFFSNKPYGTSASIGDVADFNNGRLPGYLVYDFCANNLRLSKSVPGLTWTFHQNCQPEMPQEMTEYTNILYF